MTERYCFVPSNPDIAGVGVRWAIYTQSCITAAHGFVCRFKDRHRAPKDRFGVSPSLKHTIIVQSILLIVYIVYMLVQPTTLSEFHKLFAMNLTWISYSGCYIGWFATRRMVFTIRVDQSRGLRAEMAHWWRHLGTLPTYWTWSVWLGVVLVLYAFKALQSECTEHPDAPGGRDNVSMWWLQLGGGTLVFSKYSNPLWVVFAIAVHWMSVPSSVTVILSLICPLFPARWRNRLSATTTPLAFLAVVQVLVMISSICAVEIALYESPIDVSEENIWGYGQAFPIALLFNPALSLIQEISELRDVKSVLQWIYRHLQSGLRWIYRYLQSCGRWFYQRIYSIMPWAYPRIATNDDIEMTPRL